MQAQLGASAVTGSSLSLILALSGLFFLAELELASLPSFLSSVLLCTLGHPGKVSPTPRPTPLWVSRKDAVTSLGTVFHPGPGTGPPPGGISSDVTSQGRDVSHVFWDSPGTHGAPARTSGLRIQDRSVPLKNRLSLTVGYASTHPGAQPAVTPEPSGLAAPGQQPSW